METPLLEQFDRVYIDEESLGSALAQRVQSFFSKDRIHIVKEKPLQETPTPLSAKNFERSKRHLWITPFKGSFFKRCPGAGGMVCCNYFVLNLGLQCNMNCSYCYLQSYINSPVLTLYSNIHEALLELEEIALANPHKPYRVGTGEVTDSLSLDELTLNSLDLIEFFHKYPAWTLEFKTKSSKVDQFLSVPHKGNVVVSWSINPQYIIKREEHGTASLTERFAAARKVLQKGFKVAFHMDPMIWFPEWKEHYLQLVDQIDQNFSPEEVKSITIGALRFQPEQRHMMKERFGMESLVNRGELFPTKEGKWRYDQQLRNLMFHEVMAHFKAKNPAWNVWFCMENVETWSAQMDLPPRLNPELKDYFEPLPFRPTP